MLYMYSNQKVYRNYVFCFFTIEYGESNYTLFLVEYKTMIYT